jgi:hypothetical protein
MLLPARGADLTKVRGCHPRTQPHSPTGRFTNPAPSPGPHSLLAPHTCTLTLVASFCLPSPPLSPTRALSRWGPPSPAHLRALHAPYSSAKPSVCPRIPQKSVVSRARATHPSPPLLTPRLTPPSPCLPILRVKSGVTIARRTQSTARLRFRPARVRVPRGAQAVDGHTAHGIAVAGQQAHIAVMIDEEVGPTLCLWGLLVDCPRAFTGCICTGHVAGYALGSRLPGLCRPAFNPTRAPSLCSSTPNPIVSPGPCPHTPPPRSSAEKPLWCRQCEVIVRALQVTPRVPAGASRRLSGAVGGPTPACIVSL